MEGKNSLFQRQTIVLALMCRAEMPWFPGTQAHGWTNSTAYRKRGAWKHSQQSLPSETKLCAGLDRALICYWRWSPIITSYKCPRTGLKQRIVISRKKRVRVRENSPLLFEIVLRSEYHRYCRCLKSFIRQHSFATGFYSKYKSNQSSVRIHLFVTSSFI